MTVAQDLYAKVLAGCVARPDKTVVVLDCGHFDSGLGTDDFSVNTTAIAVELVALADELRRKGLKFLFSVLIDDVGVVCSDDAMVCIVKEGPAAQEVSDMPAPVLELLSQTSGFRSNKAKLFSEKTARNRGLQFFRQKVKKDILPAPFVVQDSAQADEKQLFCTLRDGSKVLMADMHDDVIWSGHCPLLMGMHYRDVAEWAYKVIAGREYIDIIDFSLSADRGKVNAGAQVAYGVAADQPYLSRIVNICFADEDADIYTIDAYTPLAGVAV